MDLWQLTLEVEFVPSLSQRKRAQERGRAFSRPTCLWASRLLVAVGSALGRRNSRNKKLESQKLISPSTRASGIGANAGNGTDRPVGVRWAAKQNVASPSQHIAVGCPSFLFWNLTNPRSGNKANTSFCFSERRAASQIRTLSCKPNLNLWLEF
jgi:hypothetical protein